MNSMPSGIKLRTCSRMSTKGEWSTCLSQMICQARYLIMKIRIITIPILLFFAINLHGQVVDSLSMTDSLAAIIEADSVQKVKKIKGTYPVPKKAALFAIIPGGGQIYNKRWWKLPFVYGAFGGLVYSIDYNQSRYRRLRDALELERMDMEHEFSGTGIDNEQTLRSLRDEFDKNTQLSYIGLVFVYLLQSMEAYVDAHLKNFDVSDDLELKIKPQMEMTSALGQPVIGIGLSLNFGQSNKASAPPRDFLLGK